MLKLKIITIILSLLGASLACNLRPSTPEATETIAVTTEAVETLKEKVREAGRQIQSGGEVNLVLSESEVTSLIAFELAQTDPQPLTDIQVFLRAGRVRVQGNYHDGDLTLPVTIVARPEVTPGGFMRIVLVSAKLGPVSAPDVLRNQLQALLDDNLVDILTSEAGVEFQVASVEIADGFITIRGSAR